MQQTTLNLSALKQLFISITPVWVDSLVTGLGRIIFRVQLGSSGICSSLWGGCVAQLIMAGLSCLRLQLAWMNGHDLAHRVPHPLTGKSGGLLWWVGRALGENRRCKSLGSKLPPWHFCHILHARANHLRKQIPSLDNKVCKVTLQRDMIHGCSCNQIQKRSCFLKLYKMLSVRVKFLNGTELTDGFLTFLTYGVNAKSPRQTIVAIIDTQHQSPYAAVRQGPLSIPQTLESLID